MQITQSLHRSVQREPDGLAVIDGDRQLTFAQLRERVARLAAGLAALGLEPGDPVGMLAANHLEYVEYALACPWASLVISPLNNRWNLEEMAYQIDDAGIAVLIADGPRAEVALRLRDRCPTLETVIVFGADAPPAGAVDYEALLAASDAMPDTYMDPNAMAVLMYTGGTTGRPKGVMLSAGQILTTVLGVLACSPASNTPGRHLHAAPLFHVAGFNVMMQAMVVGSTHVLMGDFSVEKVVETIADKQVTSTLLIPTMMQPILEHSARTGLPLDSLRTVSYGAAPIAESVLRFLLERLPDLHLLQAYGMTEIGAATLLRDEDHRDPDHPERLRSVGRAAPYGEVRVADVAGAELPPGEIGEVVSRGAHVMMGYWRDASATADAVEGGWMHTGDLGYMDDHGYLFIVDRLKDMIVSGGENVYSAEVEAALSQHPAVASCAVIGVPDQRWGERVHAVVVLAAGSELTETDLCVFVADRIAGYKAPRTVEFVDALPLSSVGKILKRTLRETHAR